MKYLVTLLFLLTLQISSLTCGGNCPSDTCSSCWCNSTISKVSVADECKKYNWDQKCCQCIIGKESDANQKAMSVKPVETGARKTGLWQIY